VKDGDLLLICGSSSNSGLRYAMRFTYMFGIWPNLGQARPGSPCL
jgi:hypothetical protein